MAGLFLRNRFSTKTVVDQDGVTVSLTSHGDRIEHVYYTIESIARGHTRPGRIVLWLDDEKVFDSLPKSLTRLQRRGLDIQITNNYGPHTKYYPYVESLTRHVAPLVTADDDVIYSRPWLAELTHQGLMFPGNIISQRAHFIELSPSGAILPYERWSPSSGSKISARNFATGVSGVLYPPVFLNALRKEGDSFRNFAPRADDVWLHAMALRTGFQVKQVGDRPQHYPTIRGTQSANLWSSNVFGGGNDDQIRSTYTADDLIRLHES